MSEYLKREDVRRAVLHNEGDAVIAAIDELPPMEAITPEELMEQIGLSFKDEIPEQYARIAGQMVDFKTEDLTDFGRKLLCGEKRDGWIPVTERLPELTEQIESDNYCVNYSKDVLIWSPMNMIPLFEIARYTDDRGWTDPYFTRIKFQEMITHWMPLPQPPEVKE